MSPAFLGQVIIDVCTTFLFDLLHSTGVIFKKISVKLLSIAALAPKVIDTNKSGAASRKFIDS